MLNVKSLSLVYFFLLKFVVLHEFLFLCIDYMGALATYAKGLLVRRYSLIA